MPPCERYLVWKKTIEKVVSIGTNPSFKVTKVPMEYIPTIPPLSQYWWCIVKETKSGTKKWSLFGIVGIYSIGTFLTLKVGLVPIKTTEKPTY